MQNYGREILASTVVICWYQRTSFSPLSSVLSFSSLRSRLPVTFGAWQSFFRPFISFNNIPRWVLVSMHQISLTDGSVTGEKRWNKSGPSDSILDHQRDPFVNSDDQWIRPSFLLFSSLLSCVNNVCSIDRVSFTWHSLKKVGEIWINQNHYLDLLVKCHQLDSNI